MHRDTVVACVRTPGEDDDERRQEIVTFGTTTRELLPLGDWLAEHGVTVLGIGFHRGVMEAGLLPVGGPV